jgi:uncharacterized OB-fold protein
MIDDTSCTVCGFRMHPVEVICIACEEKAATPP